MFNKTALINAPEPEPENNGVMSENTTDSNDTNDADITLVNDKDALDLMGTTSLGRLVVRRSDDMDLFPLNFVVSDGKIYFRTAEGTKLFTLAEIDAKVLFEADHVDADAEGNPAHAWSVIVKGTARPHRLRRDPRRGEPAAEALAADAEVQLRGDHPDRGLRATFRPRRGAGALLTGTPGYPDNTWS